MEDWNNDSSTKNKKLADSSAKNTDGFGMVSAALIKNFLPHKDELMCCEASFPVTG